MQKNNPDKVAWLLLDLMLIVSASSTIAYEIVLFTQAQLWICYPLSMIACALLIFLSIKLKLFTIGIQIDTRTIALLALGIICMSINIFTLRPDADDFSFFHRALYSTFNLDAPIAIFHTAHDLIDIPAISPVHLTASYEVMTALLANAFGISPLFFYQIINGALCLFFVPLVYYAFYRYFGFSFASSCIGVVVVLFYLIYSGDSHRDWGNFTIVRAWQGKCILILLITPLASLATYKFAQNHSLADCLRLQFIAITGIGLSGSAFFIVPFVIAFTFFGDALAQWRQPELLKKSVLLSTILIPFAIIACLIKLEYLPSISNVDAWQLISTSGVRPEIAILERTVFKTKTTLLFYLISIAGLLLYFRSNKRIKALALTSLFVSISLVVQPISTLLIKITLAGAYWRLAYATQMLLVIATFTVLCITGLQNKGYFKEKIPKVFGFAFALSFFMLKTPAITYNIISRPHYYKFSTFEVNASRLLASWIPNDSVVLAPEKLIPSLGLMMPHTALVCTRRTETLHVFTNAGRKDEALTRIAAQKDLETCGANGSVTKSLVDIPSISLLVFPSSCEKDVIERNIGIYRKNWSIKSTSKYQAWLKNAR